ncbi:MAG TPA: hypothetical protein VL084_08690 [Thermoanaerobaculia bacterium]|nr:hypothetical protein [Thermoanaerobaculia bacterium]
MAFVRRMGPALLCAAGVLMTFHPMILSGLARMETDPGDTRHLNYVLEHGYRWLLSDPGHRELWSPPVFFPETNTAAYSETLFGVLPFYVPWRFLGAAPDTALQWWIFTVALLNFPASYLLLRRALGLRALPASLGAFLFSFGSPRVVQSGHQHLIAQFFTVLAVIALVQLFAGDESPAGGSRRTGWIAVFFGSLVAQAYAGFYLSWFFALALSLALLVSLFVRETRRRLVWLVSRHGLAVAASAVASLIALAPLARHYLEAAAVVGPRDFRDASRMLPPLKAWFNLGPHSWLYGGFRRAVFEKMPFEWEKELGIGAVTLLVALYGLVREWKRPGARVLILTSFALILLATSFPGGFTLWHGVFATFPAGTAIRAVSRVGVLLLLPASIGVAYAFDRASRTLRLGWVLPVAALVILEQGQSMPSYSKEEARRDVAAAVRRIPGGCRTFFVAFPAGRKPNWEAQLDGMWAGLEAGLPTVNGYSSNWPPGWLPLYDNLLHGPADEERLRASLRGWLAGHGLDPAGACFVTMP